MAKLKGMNFFEKLRYTTFFLLDYIKGKKVKKQLDSITLFYKYKIDNQLVLNKMLKHAIQTVPFYTKMNQNSRIEDFKVVDKSIIKSSFNDFLSSKLANEKLISMTTSGSTGTPFTVYQDSNKKDRNHADTLYFGELAGYKLGYCVIYMKIWAKEKMLPDWKYRLQNIVPVDVIKLDKAQIESIISKLENYNSNFSILGYVSALEQIIQHLESKEKSEVNSKIRSIITMSEGLSVETKSKLENIFNCSVVSRYSNLENGIIAQQLINENRFLVNSASYIVEIISTDSDQVLSDGELGRIVITDLYNYAMPMIRYDTGDLGIIEKEDNNIYLTRVEGRKLDVLFDTKGQVVSSYIMYKNMWQYTEIAQYQLIQTEEKAYLFKINCKGSFKKEAQLIGEFKEYLGADADFKVEYVNEIPLLDSGKRRKTVNLYKTTIQ